MTSILEIEQLMNTYLGKLPIKYTIKFGENILFEGC